MASYSVARAKHATLSGTTVDTVTLTIGSALLITNRHATIDMSITVDGTTPTALGDDTYIVRAGEAKSIDLSSDTLVVKIIGNANPYSVEGV